MSNMTNIIDVLAGVTLPERAARPEAVANAERSFEALFESSLLIDVPVNHRYATAAFIAGISGDARAFDFYADLLGDEDEALVDVVAAAVEVGRSTGPYSGGDFVLFGGAEGVDGLDAKLAAAFDFAHLLTFHPKDASPAAIGHLQEVGYTETGIVSLSQLISFVAFQLRVACGCSQGFLVTQVFLVLR